VIKWNGRKYNTKEDPKLNRLQQEHMKGVRDLYAPTQTDFVKWEHKQDRFGDYISASPIESTRIRRDLPSIAQQWKEDYQRRYGNG